MSIRKSSSTFESLAHEKLRYCGINAVKWGRIALLQAVASTQGSGLSLNPNAFFDDVQWSASCIYFVSYGVISTFFTLAILSLVQPALGQQLNHTIQGSVAFDGGFTFQSIVVYLESLSARPVEEVYVDVSGNFVFRNVPAGTYYIRVKQEGFQEFAQRIEVPAYNRDVTVYLQRKPNAPAPEEELSPGDRFKVDIRRLSVPEKAVREYKQALEDDKRGRTSRAIERLRRALNIAPDFLEAAAHLGSTLYKTGHFEDAEKALKRALTMAPKDSRLRLMLANAFAKEGKYQQALTEIDTYLKENPKGPERKSAETTRAQLIQVIER